MHGLNTCREHTHREFNGFFFCRLKSQDNELFQVQCFLVQVLEQASLEHRNIASLFQPKAYAIPDTHFSHQLTVVLHSQGQQFLLVHSYKTQIASAHSRRSQTHTAQHNMLSCICSLYSGLAQSQLCCLLCSRKAASTSTQVVITHQLTHTSTVSSYPNNKSMKANFKALHATSN